MILEWRLEEETKGQITMKKLEVQHSSLSPDCCDKFDMNLRFCLVPLFNDKDVDKYFIIFECVATSRKPQEI